MFGNGTSHFCPLGGQSRLWVHLSWCVLLHALPYRVLLWLPQLQPRGLRSCGQGIHMDNFACLLHVDGGILNCPPTQGTRPGLDFLLRLHLHFWSGIDSVCPDTCLMWAESIQPSGVGQLEVHGSPASHRSPLWAQ